MFATSRLAMVQNMIVSPGRSIPDPVSMYNRPMIAHGQRSCGAQANVLGSRDRLSYPCGSRRGCGEDFRVVMDAARIVAMVNLSGRLPSAA